MADEARTVAEGLVAPEEGPRTYRVLDTSSGEVIGVRGGAELEEGLRAGRFQLSSETQTVGLVDEAGNAYDVDVANLGAALADGRYRLETPEEATALEARRFAEANPTRAAAEAFAANAANEASFGLLEGAFTDEGRAYVDAAREASPIASAAGTITGIVAPALLTGGGSGATRGLAALTPSGATALAGNAVERALLARFGEGVASRALSTVGGAVTDGALSGVAAAVTRSNIEGTPLEAEQVFSDALFGAALGLGGGLVVGTGREALRGAARALRGGTGERLAQYAERLTSRGLGEAPAPRQPTAVQRALAWASGVDPEDLAAIASNPARAFDSAGFASATRGTAESLSALRSRIDEAAEALIDVERRRSAFASAAEGVDNATARATATGVLEATRTRVAQAVESLGADARTSTARGLRGLADEVDRAIAGVADEAATGATALSEVDRVIAAIDDVARRSDDAATAGVLAELRTTLGNVAGDATAFGGAGARWAELDSARRALDEARTALGLDARAISEAVTTRGGSEATAALARALDSTDEAAATLERIGVDVGPARAALAQARESIGSTAAWGELRGAAQRGLASEGGQGARGAVMQFLGGRAAKFAGGAIGATLGGPVGAAAGTGLGAIVDAAQNPVSTYQRLAHLGDSLRSYTARLDAGIGRLEQAITKARALGSPASAVRTSSRVVTGLRGTPEQRRAEYRHVSEELRTLAADPDALGARLGDTIAPVSDASPQLADAMTAAAVRGVAYLAQSLPAIDRAPMFPGDEVEPSQWEIDRFLRRYEAVEDPLSILDRAADGSLHVEHRQAVEAVYPEVMSEIQARVAELLGGLEQRPSYQQRLTLGVLLGVPADRSLQPDMIAALQSHYAQTPQQYEIVNGPAGRLDSSTSENTLSGTEEIASRL